MYFDWYLLKPMMQIPLMYIYYDDFGTPCIVP